jgi:hypothetical protein
VRIAFFIPECPFIPALTKKVCQKNGQPLSKRSMKSVFCYPHYSQQMRIITIYNHPSASYTSSWKKQFLWPYQSYAVDTSFKKQGVQSGQIVPSGHIYTYRFHLITTVDIPISPVATIGALGDIIRAVITPHINISEILTLNKILITIPWGFTVEIGRIGLICLQYTKMQMLS